MNPFFSIIIPCCDVEPYLRECLDSVANQPFKDWECLLGVEESKDDTEKIAREYAAKDPRFKVFTGPRSGSCSASRNTGIDNARGEYIIFLDGDDTIAEGSLQRLHDKIAARPGADLYACAMLVYENKTGRELERRDNYPSNFSDELTGPEAILAFKHLWLQHFCPMLQLVIFRRNFLQDHQLRCIHGLRCQDSEFTPRALYFAGKVVPLHEPFYLYRIRECSVQTIASGTGYFLKDWSVILKSLFHFHATVSRETGFDASLTSYWCQQWTTWLFYNWFDKKSISNIPRRKRHDTLSYVFSEGFGDFFSLLKGASIRRKIAASWVFIFVRCPLLGWMAEQFFTKIYTPLIRLRDRK